VHGDVSPKNILVGPAGPVILDAECAWYGDPAFDVAFCLNHLLLKSVWQPKLKRKLMDAFEAFVSTYLSAIDWEDRTVFEERAAALLPALMLARVDGKSPAEYLNSEGDRNLIRRFAKTRLIAPMRSLSVLGGDWVTAK
jgi:aminoglycoside phosphotransferase (APT) family kinase protein